LDSKNNFFSLITVKNTKQYALLLKINV
jgi:hypothetical protein